MNNILNQLIELHSLCQIRMEQKKLNQAISALEHRSRHVLARARAGDVPRNTLQEEVDAIEKEGQRIAEWNFNLERTFLELEKKSRFV